MTEAVLEPPRALPKLVDEAPQSISYWGSVWRRLKKNRLAVLGLYAVGGLLVLATTAPIVALNQPFFWRTAAGAQFPWFRALFNRLLFESAVDVFFNLALLLAPVVLLAVGIAARLARQRSLRVAPGRMLAASGIGFLLLFFAIAPEHWGPAENPFHFTERVINYRSERARMESAGEVVAAWFPLNPYSYRETNPTESLEEPSKKHWLGTDTEGRDVFARMLYGTRISLTIGVVAVLIYVSIGVVLGALAGYFGGWVDNVISRLIEIVITFPSFFLILTLAALVQERSIFHVMLIIGVTSWTGVARLIRAEFLRQKSLDYVQAALALGLEARRVIFFHILPNAVAPALVSATFGIATAILIESSLSFLGVGDRSVASWGETLNTGRLTQKLWLVLAPGSAIFFVVTVFNLVGEGVRDALDPKLRT